jgi:carotenoid 1,2-hydratase
VNHCAVTVALYQARGGRWAMTERGRARVQRDAASLSIGPSAMHWTGTALEIDVDEICAPWPRRLQGRIRVSPEGLCAESFALDADGLHRWTPFAPRARVEVQMREPDLRWSGVGYFDSNHGAAPLEDTFAQWSWSRASHVKRTVVLYDTQPLRAASRSLALHFDQHAQCHRADPPPETLLPRTRWRLARPTRADPGHAAHVLKTLEDAPFYSRSLLDTRVFGARGPAIHESLSLDRFRARWVQCLLPFRMPRIAF